MLVDYPQTVGSGGQNERFAQLPQRVERAYLVEVGGGLLSLDQSRFSRGIGAGGVPGARGAVSGGRQAGWREERCRGLTPRLPIVPVPAAGMEALGGKGQLARNRCGKAWRQLEGFCVSLGGLECGWVGVGR